MEVGINAAINNKILQRKIHAHHYNTKQKTCQVMSLPGIPSGLPLVIDLILWFDMVRE